MTIENEKKEETNLEAEKVEESLRDFIGRIVSYYEKHNISSNVLTKYEKKISSAETLLEVFEVMKEMFEELMSGVGKHTKLISSIAQKFPQTERTIQSN